jgi:hypothetical protein
MVTRVTQSKVPRNPRVGRMASKDAVSPSVRGLKTVIPSTVGIAERARYEYRKASIIVDTIRLVHAAQRSGDASLIAAAKPFVPLIKKALDQLGRSVDSLARESAAISKKDKPEAQTPSALIDPPALVEGDPKVAAGLIGDSAWANHTPETLERRAKHEAFSGQLQYAMERGDYVEANRLRFGMPARECEDPYKSMGHQEPK